MSDNNNSDDDIQKDGKDTNKLLDRNQNPIQTDSKEQNHKVSGGSSGSEPNSCMFDWSPHADFDDYAKKLNLWIWECQQWCHFHANYQAIVAQATAAASSPTANGLLNSTGLGLNQQQQSDNSRSGTVYAIPKIWKRFLAELVDCVLLLVFKLSLTFFLSDYMPILNIEELELRIFNNDNLEDNLFELSYEFLVIAIIHRIIVCVYETCSLYGVSGPNSGGATPGKVWLGIKVVSCTSIEPLPNNLVRVSPAGNIGFLYCLMRALIKNLSIVFFIPACFTIIGSSYNRTAYDVLCNCIVVENQRTGTTRAPPPPPPQAQQQAAPPRANQVN